MIGRAAVLAIVMLAGVAPASADPSSEALIHDFVAWVDSSPDWSASASLIRSEGRDTFADGLVFSRDNPRVSISVEELRLSNLEAREGGGFEASEIEMRSGEVVTEFMDIKVPSAAADGASLPSLAGVTLDPRHMMRSIARFYAIAAKARSAE